MKTGSILIVEDDVEMCEELAEILRFEGFEVMTAHDGLAGKRLFDDGDYSLVLLDLRLPEFDGAELLGHIKGNSSLPVLVLTGKPIESELGELQGKTDRSGRRIVEIADGFIEKPFLIEQLIETVELLVSRDTCADQ